MDNKKQSFDRNKLSILIFHKSKDSLFNRINEKEIGKNNSSSIDYTNSNQQIYNTTQ